MHLDGARSDPEFLGNRFAGAASQNSIQNLALTAGHHSDAIACHHLSNIGQLSRDRGQQVLTPAGCRQDVGGRAHPGAGRGPNR